MSRTSKRVAFQPTGDARHPFAAEVDGERWLVRINEFPEEPSIYSLFVDGVRVEELLEWPAAWSRSEASASSSMTSRSDADAHEKAEFERDEAHFERTLEIRPSKRMK